jgi:hypothetical protein
MHPSTLHLERNILPEFQQRKKYLGSRASRCHQKGKEFWHLKTEPAPNVTPAQVWRDRTHTYSTCCRRSICTSMEPKLSKDEIEEIMDEEKELAMILDQEIDQLEKTICDCFEFHLLEALFKLQDGTLKESERYLQPKKYSSTSALFHR